MLALFCATLGFYLGIAATNAPLQNDVAPLGILSLQFAGGFSSAAEILGSWGEAERLYAGFNLGLDYAFLVSYALFLSLTCSCLARAWPSSPKHGFSTIGFFLAWAMLAAGALDMVENVALLQLLLGSTSAHWPALGTACAIPKFGIILAGIVYIAVGMIARLRNARR
jgi:hypothetical protein